MNKPLLEKMVNRLASDIYNVINLSFIAYTTNPKDDEKDYDKSYIEEIIITLENLVYECDRYYGVDNVAKDIFKFAKCKPIKKPKTYKECVNGIRAFSNDTVKIVRKYFEDDSWELKKQNGEWLSYFNPDGFEEEVENFERIFKSNNLSKLVNGLKIDKDVEVPKTVEYEQMLSNFIHTLNNGKPDDIADKFQLTKRLIFNNELGDIYFEYDSMRKHSVFPTPSENRDFKKRIIYLSKKEIDDYFKADVFKKSLGKSTPNVKDWEFVFVGTTKDYFMKAYLKALNRETKVPMNKLESLFAEAFKNKYREIAKSSKEYVDFLDGLSKK